MKIISIIFISVLFFTFGLQKVDAYSLNSVSPNTNSLFGKNPLQYSPIDLNKFIQPSSSGGQGLSFSDLINTKSFSSQDIGSSLKAVLILFVRLIITTLTVTLGIFKALLDVLTKAV